MHGKSVSILEKKAAGFMSSREYSKALLLYRKVLQLPPPRSYNCLIGCANANKALGNFNESLVFYAKARAVMPEKIDALLGYIEVCLGTGKFSDALYYSREAMRYFPNHPGGFIWGIHALMRLRRYTDAEAVALEGQRNIPDHYVCYLLYAEIALRQRHWAEFIYRYTSFRSKFGSLVLPLHHVWAHHRIIRSFIAIENGYMEQHRSYRVIDLLTRYAENRIASRHYKSALMWGKMLQEMYNNKPNGYIIAIRSCKMLKDIEAAFVYAIKGLIICKGNKTIILEYASILASMNKNEELIYFLKYWYEQTKDTAYLLELKTRYMSLCLFDEADVIASELSTRDSKRFYHTDNIIKRTLHEYRNDPVSCRLAIINKIRPVFMSRFLSYSISSQRDILTLLLTTVTQLCEYSSHIIDIYNKFMLALFRDHQKNNGKPNTKIAFHGSPICDNAYLFPILSHIPPERLVIILDKPTPLDQKVIAQYNMGKYELIYGRDNLEDFETIICQGALAAYSHKKLIYIAHSNTILASKSLLNISSLVIYQTEAHTRINTVQLPNTRNVPQQLNLSNLDHRLKCEVAYTGTFPHSDFYISDRNKYLNLLIDKYGFVSDHRKNTLLIIDSPFIPEKSIINLVNSFSQIYNVIFKPFIVGVYNSIKKRLNEINPSVLIIDNEFLGTNQLRVCADFILTNYSSGSLTSSVLLSQIVLPYYSQYIINRRNHNAPLYFSEDLENRLSSGNNYLTLMPINKKYNDSPTNALIRFFYEHKKLYDIARPDLIYNQLQSGSYISWYKNRIKYIQREIFGNYEVKHAAKLTAEYIMRFADNGTLNADCAALYFKDSFFQELHPANK